jgi:hypothetical protein
MLKTPDRRSVLAAAGAALLVPAGRGCAQVSATAAADPSTLRLASGSPAPDGMVF